MVITTPSAHESSHSVKPARRQEGLLCGDLVELTNHINSMPLHSDA